MERVFAIGDVHGHYDRLIALLQQEGIIDENEHRVDHDCVVVQLGDLGHFGMTRGDGKPPVPKSPTADKLCYEIVERGLVDYTLWGNHDRAVFDRVTHEFGGYVMPPVETVHLMRKLHDQGKYLLAYGTEKFLLTHAGLHKVFKHNEVPVQWKADPKILADALNDYDDHYLQGISGQVPLDKDYPHWGSLVAIMNAIGAYRGGRSPYGGILWRDAGESLYDGFRQVFGHSAKDKVRTYYGDAGGSYCVDIGDALNGRLAGIWIEGDETKVAQVKV